MIQLKKITKTYNAGSSNAFEALHNITLTISDGEMVSIIGKSGAGKSTLLHIIGCIDHYDDGEYYLDDELIKNKKDKALTLKEIVNIPGAKQVMLMFFCYCALEQTTGLWASSYLVLQHGFDLELSLIHI